MPWNGDSSSVVPKYSHTVVILVSAKEIYDIRWIDNDYIIIAATSLIVAHSGFQELGLVRTFLGHVVLDTLS